MERLGKRTSKRFRTKREAELWAAQQEASIVDAAEKPHYSHTVRDAVERYIRDVTSRKQSERAERLRLLAFVRDNPELADMVLADVRPADLVEWRERRLRTVSASSVLREVTPIRHMFKLSGMEWGWMPRESPWDAVRMPHEPPPRNRRIAPGEVRRIVRALGFCTGRNPASRMEEVAWAFMVSLRTAMRSSEVLGLSRSSVDLKARVVTLKHHKTVQKVGARQVPITRHAARLLRVLDDAAKAAGRDAYFLISSQVKDTLFRRVVSAIGIENLHFHDARAEALTKLAKRVDVMVLARISGHSDLKILLNTYYRATAAEIAADL